MWHRMKYFYSVVKNAIPWQTRRAFGQKTNYKIATQSHQTNQIHCHLPNKSLKKTKSRSLVEATSSTNFRVLVAQKHISKIVERAEHMQLYNYLDDNNLIYMRQFGFRRKRST